MSVVEDMPSKNGKFFFIILDQVAFQSRIESHDFEKTSHTLYHDPLYEP